MNSKDVRQWQYEHGERALPEAPRSIGNWSLAGVIWRLSRRRRDRLDDAARRMRAEAGRSSDRSE
jgi:hypothetical protein